MHKCAEFRGKAGSRFGHGNARNRWNNACWDGRCHVYGLFADLRGAAKRFNIDFKSQTCRIGDRRSKIRNRPNIGCCHIISDDHPCTAGRAIPELVGKAAGRARQADCHRRAHVNRRSRKLRRGCPWDGVQRHGLRDVRRCQTCTTDVACCRNGDVAAPVRVMIHTHSHTHCK